MYSVEESISASFLDVLGTSTATNSPLVAAGLDSAAAVEFANMLTDRFAAEFPATLLYDHPTIDSVAEFILEGTCVGGEWQDTCILQKRQHRVDAAPCVASSVAASLADSFSFMLPGHLTTRSGLKHFVTLALATNSSVPISRW